MFAYTVRRLLQMIPLLFAASVVIYALLALQPGDPLDELRRQNPRMTAEQFEALKRAYGLDQPLHIRYFKWLNRALRGDLGYSRTYGIPAAEYVFVQRLPKTLILSGLALTLALVVAIPVGVFSAVRQYSLADYAITFLSFVGFSMPVFFLGILLLYLFAIVLPESIPGFPRFPTGGVPGVLWEDVRSGAVSLWEFLGQWAWHLVLPVLTLSALQMAEWTRFMRASLLEVLSQDYIRTARAKGLPERQVAMGHALRNAFLPVLSYLGPATAIAMTGSFVIEKVFAVPGIGRNFVDAVMAKDITLIMGVVLVYSILLVLFNLIVDVLYSWIDPRISL